MAESLSVAGVKGSRWLGTLDTLHAAAAGIWIGGVGMVGTLAAIAFPTIKKLNPTVPEFAAVGDHWKIAAGSVANKMFVVADSVSLVCCLVCLATLGLGLSIRVKRGREHARSALWIFRTLAMTVAAGCLAYQLFILGPRMSENVHVFWDAARAGEVAKANAAQAAFDADHPIASNIIVSMFAAAWALLVGALIESKGGARS